MKLLSNIHDSRINSTNLYVETTYGEYLEYAKKIVKNNEFQRKRVRNSKSVYTMLKNDLKIGCVIPPIVLAIASENPIDININDCDLLDYMNSHLSEVMILDGLQRTYTMIDAEREVSELEKKEFYDKPLRLEIYININKFGILYRMLTLNTGQTPMSTRHQIEMLYSSKINTRIEDVTLVSDTQGKANAERNEFVFRNVVEGFCSYMNRNELPLDRQDLLDNIAMLGNMTNESVDNDLFEEFLTAYIRMFSHITKNMDGMEITDESLGEYGIKGAPFAKNIAKAFATSQAMTGFGAALGIMKDKKVINGMDDITRALQDIEITEDNSWFMEFLVSMDKIRNNSKKIGNAQRMYFKYFFRELFNKDGDSYANLADAAINAYQKYDSQVN